MSMTMCMTGWVKCKLSVNVSMTLWLTVLLVIHYHYYYGHHCECEYDYKYKYESVQVWLWYTISISIGFAMSMKHGSWLKVSRPQPHGSVVSVWVYIWPIDYGLWDWVSVNNTHCNDIGFDYHYKLWSMVKEYQCEFNFSDSSVSV